MECPQNGRNQVRLSVTVTKWGGRIFARGTSGVGIMDSGSHEVVTEPGSTAVFLQRRRKKEPGTTDSRVPPVSS